MTDSAFIHSLWSLPDDVVYLNHGSFGPSPRVVQESRERWSRRLESQPMNFFMREMEAALEESLATLAKFVGTSRGNLVFVENATAGMNIVAQTFALNSDDEVLLTDHEYGAVTRLWRRRARQTGARVVIQEIPLPLCSAEETAAAFFSAVTDRTKLIVISHVTSPTALILPVDEICRLARERGIPVCIDGPHAVAMLPLDLRRLDCDFYTASCHKWLCAPFGSGFLYTSPRWQKKVEPAVISWGGSVSGRQPSWKDEFVWSGTRDPAAYLAVADAIQFFEQPLSDEHEVSALETFRSHASELLALARERIVAVTCLEPLASQASHYGSMLSFPLPIEDDLDPQQRHPIQDALWDRYRIEIPIVHWQGRRSVRVSAHLYNTAAEIEHLAQALTELLRAS
jgi:isopenicillin-N epimerase